MNRRPICPAVVPERSRPPVLGIFALIAIVGIVTTCAMMALMILLSELMFALELAS